MRIDHILLGKELRSDLAHVFKFLFELFSALWGGSVNTEHEFVFLISMSE